MGSGLSNILGEPGTGFHSTRFIGLAFYDLIGVFIFAFILQWYIEWTFILAMCRVFIFAQICHLFFWVKTSLLVDYPLQLTIPILALAFYGCHFDFNEVILFISFVIMILTSIVLRFS